MLKSAIPKKAIRKNIPGERIRMKHAIVWGAAGGIGKALTQKLIDVDYSVVAISRHPGEMSTITPHSIATDVSVPSQVRAAVHQARSISKSFDLYLYTAGEIASIKNSDMSEKNWQRILDANLTGAFLTAQASLPLLTPDAKFVFMGAIHERLRLPGLSAYATAKAGLEAFAETLRKESRQRVLVVRPSAVNTPFWSKVPFSMPKNALEPVALADRILQALDSDSNDLLLNL
jgi:NAD(P)-dependent dehydrogenase (short-subunit alcohol dehydrogenase family)